jgi:aminoglycoside phosphotransferase family enzyme/predicted kinase
LAPGAYPHAVQSVHLIETHISWVLLTGEWAYKIKRPVRYPFVDLRSAEHRAFLCHEEVRLNKRFAPDLYVSVCPITQSDGEARMEGAGRVIEYAVKMHQFPREEALDRLLETDRVGIKELAEFGDNLARIHAALPVSTAAQDWGRPEAVRAQILENFEQCATAAAVFDDTGTVNALRHALESSLELAQNWMDVRWQNGRVRECHGDLHCGNIVRRGTQLLAFDCLEFDPALRWVDVAQEVATLLADLRTRSQHPLAAAFLGGYLAQAGDYQACRLLNLYQAHRSLVRAKVMALTAMNIVQDHGDTTDIRREYQRYADCAKGLLSPNHPTLILMNGLSGSGKTWLAQLLAPRLAAVHLSSDLERKRLAGLAEIAPLHSRQTQDKYSPEARAQVYQQLASCATDTLAGGYTTIVDATFGSREERAQFKALAANLVIPVCLVHCKAPQELLRARIDERLKLNSDLSEADLQVLDWQERHTEPIAPEEGIRVLEVNTADPLSLEGLNDSLAHLSSE